MRKTAHVPPRWWLSDTHHALAQHGPEYVATFCAMLSGPASQTAGVAYMAPSHLAEMAGITPERASDIVDTMHDSGAIVFDRAHNIVWIPGAIEIQLGRADWWLNAKWLTHTVRHLESLPDSPAVEAFLERYRIVHLLKGRYPLHNRSIGYPYPTDTPRIGSFSSCIPTAPAQRDKPPTAAHEKAKQVPPFWGPIPDIPLPDQDPETGLDRPLAQEATA